VLRKYSHNRTLSDNIKLSILGALIAGMINVASFMIFVSFSSNVTGYFAILASEVVSGNMEQIMLVSFWIMLYISGSFTAGFMVTNLFRNNSYLAHATPLILQLLCILTVGFYCNFFYQETLLESEFLLSLLLFSMGLQNGLTASITNFQVKTTHLTGAVTDLGVIASMLTKPEFRTNKALLDKGKLIVATIVGYVAGGILFGMFFKTIAYNMFYVVAGLLLVMITYDQYTLWALRFRVIRHKRRLEMEMEVAY
jgi:uncharacterized membrane protein YoaK (UPF0700 family)